MTNLPKNIQDKCVPLLLEHLAPENFAETLGLLPHQVKPVWDKVVYAFSLGVEFGYISCAENLAEQIEEIFPETKGSFGNVFTNYAVGKNKGT